MTEASTIVEAFIFTGILLGSACPVVASLERILGRPIPRLKYSPPVQRSRAFLAVPIAMAIVFSVFLWLAIRSPFSAYQETQSIWSKAWMTLELTVFSSGLAGVTGWIVFSLVWIVFKGKQFVVSRRDR